LEQILRRGGSLDLVIRRNAVSDGHDIPWQALLVDLTEDRIVVHRPMTVGTPLDLAVGTELTVIMAIGQNRWMFPTVVVASTDADQSQPVLVLEMPETVERCQRRRDYRVEATSIAIPGVELWPLLDPSSAVACERVNELLFEAELDSTAVNDAAVQIARSQRLNTPDVGPGCEGRLQNIGGGGIGMVLRESCGGVVSSHQRFWLRFSLAPEIVTPVCVAASVAHRHRESGGLLYVGMRFDFSANPAHQRCVARQIARYIAVRQRGELSKSA
jgi:c-di-GMP-binding flagellar brake protein YcgR